MESATENNHLSFCKKCQERVKMCGKSAQISSVMAMLGKPYLEQGKQCKRSSIPV